MEKQLTNHILSDATEMSVSGAESSMASDINKQDVLGSLGIETVSQEESLEDGNPGQAYYEGEAYAEAEAIIEFSEELTVAQIDGIKSDMLGINYTEYVIPNTNIQLVNIGESDMESFILEHQNNPQIKSVSPNYIITIPTTKNDELTPSDKEPLFSNDPYFSRLWGLHNTGQFGGKTDSDIDGPEAWGHQTGSKDVVVGVIDSGIDYNHPDLKNNIWKNQAEIDGKANVDDDNNGYVDDKYGYDFAYNDGDPMDRHGHGTHVAGTIGAEGDNKIGVAGVNKNVSLMALKFLNDQGRGTMADAIEAVKYATLMGADLTNNSWGGGSYSRTLKDTIEKGPLFFAAAGNAGKDNDKGKFYPASYDSENIVAVASTDRNDNRSWFSNYGATSVDLGAPGSFILSTYPNNGYRFLNGTSMATPHVAGVGALLLAEDPNLTDKKVKDTILNSVDKIGSLKGKTVTGGRLNAHEALLLAKGDPGTVIDFEKLKHNDRRVGRHGFLYKEDGFVLENKGRHSFATFGTYDRRFSGSTALFNNTGNGVTILSAENNGSFDLDSIDMAEVVFPRPAKVTFTGKLEKGGSVRQTFTLDGNSFEPQTFTFSDDFDEVVSVEWRQAFPYHQFDNITIGGKGTSLEDPGEEPEIAIDNITIEDPGEEPEIVILEEFNESDGYLSASFDGVTSDFSLGIGAEGISMSDSLMSVLDTAAASEFLL